MKKYIGVDLGKRKAVVLKKDRLGKITGRAILAVTRPALENYFSKQDRRARLWWKPPGTGCTSTRIEKHVPEVMLAHPLNTHFVAVIPGNRYWPKLGAVERRLYIFGRYSQDAR